MRRLPYTVEYRRVCVCVRERSERERRTPAAAPVVSLYPRFRSVKISVKIVKFIAKFKVLLLRKNFFSTNAWMHAGNDIKNCKAARTWGTSPKEGIKSFNFLQNSKLGYCQKFMERSSLHEGDLFHRKWNVTTKPLPDHTRSSLTVCPCVRTHLRCRYAWVALSRSFLRCGMLEYRCLALTDAERTYPKPADRVSAIKEKPSILSHTSTDIWHRFKFQRPMFTNWHTRTGY